MKPFVETDEDIHKDGIFQACKNVDAFVAPSHASQLSFAKLCLDCRGSCMNCTRMWVVTKKKLVSRYILFKFRYLLAVPDVIALLGVE